MQVTEVAEPTLPAAPGALLEHARPAGEPVTADVQQRSERQGCRPTAQFGEPPHIAQVYRPLSALDGPRNTLVRDAHLLEAVETDCMVCRTNDNRVAAAANSSSDASLERTELPSACITVSASISSTGSRGAAGAASLANSTSWSTCSAPSPRRGS
eukprot:CAMPEP_0171275800 /NCGR_PEP_ID=MMETSP0790-20130122/63510_1 /TAXON_ID=2925 /ORGANISM="Alexandrium catenella, Strain OF101" /LENGTH=155 /DNA_ID=CAMNT_0011744877 /DNA_START=120 /DNA_END=585 /DNA_ORIENTATION=-